MKLPVRLSGQALFMVAFALMIAPLAAGELLAGVGRTDITDYDAGPVNDPLYAKALVLRSGATELTIVTLDVVAIGAYGRVNDDFLPALRRRLATEHGIAPETLLVNASHCHGTVCVDVLDRTIAAVAAARKELVPVRIGSGAGREHRIMENRRFLLKDGAQVDSRRAYPLPPDSEFASVGPVDPEIGVLRLDRPDGQTLAVLYNFACHPIQGVPGGGNTADMIGFASKVIEENSNDGTMALFLQGCAGDINPAFYKDTAHPQDAEPLGNLLGLATLRALRDITTADDDRLTVLQRSLKLPRADFTPRITKLEAEQTQLLQQLQGTPINFKTFLPLLLQHELSEDFPSHYAHRYLHEEAMGAEHLKHLDAQNRRDLDTYLSNIHTMEALTRVQANLRLLRKHQAENEAAHDDTLDVEILGVRIGDFVLLTFPGELTVQIGLDMKAASPYPNTYVAGYTNGYIYYAPTSGQLENTGHAQEDCDTLLAPNWQPGFEATASELLSALE